MELSQALNFITQSSPSSIETLCDVLPLELIKKALEQTDTVTFESGSYHSSLWFG